MVRFGLVLLIGIINLVRHGPAGYGKDGSGLAKFGLVGSGLVR